MQIVTRNGIKNPKKINAPGDKVSYTLLSNEYPHGYWSTSYFFDSK
jgi:hypothetical protein